MKNLLFTLIAAIGLTTTLAAQKKQQLPELSGMEPVTVVPPFIIDSVNIKGEKYSEKEILKTALAIPEQSAFTSSYAIGSDGYFHPPKPSAHLSLQLFSFYISCDRYAKGILKVTSPNMIELFVDGKLAKSKTERQDSTGANSNLQVTVAPYPSSSRIVVKLLAAASDNIDPAFKIEIENTKNDSVTQFAFAGTPQRRIAFADIITGNRVTGVSISPQGKYALVVCRNSTGEKSTTVTELISIKNGNRTVVDINGSKDQLNWMPQSEMLYYVMRSGNKTALITVDPATMAEHVLASDIPDTFIRFAPNEQSFFYSVRENGEKSKESSSDLRLLKSVEDRQSGYMIRSSVYRYSFATQLSRRLTYGSASAWLNDVSPDSQKALISFSEENITQRPFRKSTMLLLNIETMEADTLWTGADFTGSAAFSPDGSRIAVSGAAEAFGGIGLNVDDGQIANSYNTLAYIMDLKTKQVDAITKDFNPSIESFVWSQKDNHIYFVTADRDYRNVYACNVATKQFTRLPLKEDAVRHFRLSKNAPVAVYTGTGVSNSTRAYVYNIQSQQSTLIADPYGEQLSQLRLGQVNDWNFKNSSGITIEGRYYLPPDFDASQKYPTIVYYYGGTTPTLRSFESMYPPHVFAAQNYIVYVIQPSGAIGYGQQFAAMHVNTWGRQTVNDIIEGTTLFAHEHAFVDASKIGCIGASYGGFTTMLLQTQTNMFAAAVSHAGISSITSYWGEGYWGYSYSSAASAHSYPWNSTEMYVKQSPLFSADKINTPILLTHGTADTNVPIGESIQMYTALKILGKPVEFIQVKDENHGIVNYRRRIEWHNSIMAWFARWLKNDATWWNDLYPPM